MQICDLFIDGLSALGQVALKNLLIHQIWLQQIFIYSAPLERCKQFTVQHKERFSQVIKCTLFLFFMLTSGNISGVNNNKCVA